MVDSNTVLWGQTIMYTAYCLAIVSLMWWFARRVTQASSSRFDVSPKLFYGWVGFLVVLGVSLHLITYNTIPWVKDDLHGATNVAQSYDITVADHTFTLPSPTLEVPCDKLVRFSVTSKDLTYGFGLFRSNNSMVLQMQVVPGHPNDLVWTFHKNGTYTIRSTEYSGPKGAKMTVPNAVRVSGCAADDIHTTAAGATR